MAIGNGKTVNIRTHNWIPNQNQALYKLEDLNTNDYQWVSELIDCDTGQWDVPLLKHLFTPQQVDSIFSIPFILKIEILFFGPLLQQVFSLLNLPTIIYVT